MDNGSHSSGSILKGVLASFLAAALVTVLFVLPAEYGKDPTGVGDVLGLTGIAAERHSPAMVMEGAFPAIVEDFDEYEPPVIGPPFSATLDGGFATQTLNISLQPGEQVEYKAVMERGDMLVYSWTSNASEIYTDFHADPGRKADGYPAGYFVRYVESESGEGHGSIVAPFTGNHGWYWLNISEEDVDIELRIAGYFDTINELGRSFQY